MNIAELSIKRPIFITCIFAITLLVGILSLSKLPVDLFPDVTFPVVVITTPYLGAGPLEVETLVSKPIEDELSTISGVKSIRSQNKEGMSAVIVEFLFDVDIKYAEQQVRDKVSFARSKLPEDIREPVIRRIDPADQPVLVTALSADLPEAELFDLADEVIRPKLQQVNQVGLVQILGGRKREIRVELDQKKLREYELSASAVSQHLASAGENIPAGSVAQGASQLVYRSLAQFRSLKDIASIVITFFANEHPVRTEDLGKVVDSLEEEQSRVFIRGEKALTLQVFRQSGSNTIAVVNAVKERIAQLNEQYKDSPQKTKLEIVRDGSKQIKANVDDVTESIILGILLTVLVVLFFLGNFRSTMITSLALPNSLLGAFILMHVAGFSVNIMTLLALSLSVGLLIDDAIVVRENIYRHFEMGKSARQAAIEGTNEVLLPVIATTLTVISVFGPIAFLQGMIGQFFKEFGLTICFAMMISLFDAITMAPMLSTYFPSSHHAGPRGFFASIWESTIGRALKAFDRLQGYLENVYEKAIYWTVKHPLTVMGSAFLIFVASLGVTKFIPKTFLPPQDQGEFQVSVELPPGTSLEGTSTIARSIEDLILKNTEVETTLTTVGNFELETNRASVFVRLTPYKNRTVNTTDMKMRVREQLKEFSHANPIVGDVNAVGSNERPFMLNIVGPDLEKIEAYAKQVYDGLKNHPSLTDVDLSFKAGKPEFQFQIDSEKAERLGVSTKAAGYELRTLVAGNVPAVYRQNGREYDIRVRLQEDQRELKNHINQVFVPNLNGRLIPLAAVAEAKMETGPAEIKRENRSRYVSIQADIAPNGPGMGGAIDAANQLIQNDLKIPEGISYGFVGQAENFKELTANMAIAVVLGITFIYLVLASLYESFITPFTIMLVLPLAICGAFFGLLLGRTSLDIFSMIGCVLLLGVATKNSILLVDLALELIRDGKDRATALAISGKTRLRPILMTSFALIAGMLPVAIGLNEASRQRTSMGIAIIGGLISSTFLTLFVIPAAFIYIDRFRNWFEGGFKKITGQTEQAKETHGAETHS